jgi:hypothetical protein
MFRNLRSPAIGWDWSQATDEKMKLDPSEAKQFYLRIGIEKYLNTVLHTEEGGYVVSVLRV